MVAIAGQAGSGKTRLITEFRTEVTQSQRAAVVLAARCHDGETALPFVLAADLLRTALAVRPDLPEVLPAQTAAMAGRLVPALAAAHPDSVAPALDSPVAVTRLYAAIADTLRAATKGGAPVRPAGAAGSGAAASGAGASGAARKPGWGGRGRRRTVGRQLVARDARLPGSAAGRLPLLLVLSWQAEQGGRLRVLRTALSEAEDQSLGEMIEPGLLGPEAIGALLDLDGMPRVEVDRLMAETRGLPMLVREYIEARRSAGDEPGGQGPETGRLVAARQRAGPAAGSAAGGQRADPADADGGRSARQRQ